MGWFQEQDEEDGGPGDEDGEAPLRRDGGRDVLVPLAPEGGPGVRLVGLTNLLGDVAPRQGAPQWVRRGPEGSQRSTGGRDGLRGAFRASLLLIVAQAVRWVARPASVSRRVGRRVVA